MKKLRTELEKREQLLWTQKDEDEKKWEKTNEDMETREQKIKEKETELFGRRGAGKPVAGISLGLREVQDTMKEGATILCILCGMCQHTTEQCQGMSWYNQKAERDHITVIEAVR